jgi:hypothetical protein
MPLLKVQAFHLRNITLGPQEVKMGAPAKIALDDCLASFGQDTGQIFGKTTTGNEIPLKENPGAGLTPSQHRCGLALEVPRGVRPIGNLIPTRRRYVQKYLTHQNGR